MNGNNFSIIQHRQKNVADESIIKGFLLKIIAHGQIVHFLQRGRIIAIPQPVPVTALFLARKVAKNLQLAMSEEGL